MVEDVSWQLKVCVDDEGRALKVKNGRMEIVSLWNSDFLGDVVICFRSRYVWNRKCVCRDMSWLKLRL